MKLSCRWAALLAVSYVTITASIHTSTLVAHDMERASNAKLASSARSWFMNTIADVVTAYALPAGSAGVGGFAISNFYPVA